MSSPLPSSARLTPPNLCERLREKEEEKKKTERRCSSVTARRDLAWLPVVFCSECAPDVFFPFFFCCFMAACSKAWCRSCAWFPHVVMRYGVDVRACCSCGLKMDGTPSQPSLFHHSPFIHPSVHPSAHPKGVCGGRDDAGGWGGRRGEREGLLMRKSTLLSR